ncbi:uncharacterized protein (DUF58 family) [Terracoccus luteus]|uniref:Uncharacterized protein (DUF58 family) n=1 Tax=Terracoccus luteus TaxID=53356 RepID=A0A495XX47_9MICO|nr:uncharacterized protein (DUF58 family) [Terracoccus luteus]
MARVTSARRSERELGRWAPTAAHVRAALLAAGAAVLAVLGRRADLLVLVAPLAVAAGWGHLARPRVTSRATARVVTPTLREGEATQLVVRVDPVPPGVDAVALVARAPWVERLPGPGVVHLDARGTGRAAVRSTRWGRRRLGTVSVCLTSEWGAFQAGPVDLPDLGTATLPVPATFDSSAPTPHPDGIVGAHRSARPGSGTEFSTIRAFQPGDRLRRIHWPTSTRTGSLHVSSTYSDEDAHVVLIVDALSDLGPREGVDGRPTSLDLTVRAAGAISQHVLRTNDRLTLRTVGAADVPVLRSGSGTNHLRRVLDVLASISPASERRDDGERAVRSVEAAALCLVLSPLVDPTMVDVAHRLAARGLTVVVVDTFPPHLVAADADRYSALSWRLRLLAREAQVSGLVGRGIPVVPWRGPGSLDQVLRDLARRSAAPRMARR